MDEHPILTLFLSEAASGKATARSLAVLYALIIAGSDHIIDGDWRRVNEAANAALGFDSKDRAGLKKIDRFRAMAWTIHHKAAERQKAVRAMAGPAAHSSSAQIQ